MLAWRAWFVGREAGGPHRLQSVIHRCDWPTGRELLARCLTTGGTVSQAHFAPESDCQCGIYGAGALERLANYLGHGLRSPLGRDPGAQRAGVGAYWAFLLQRARALAVMIPIAWRTGTARGWLDDRWRVAAWGLGDSAAYLLFVYAAGRGPVSVASVLVAQFATVAVLVGMLFGGERLLARQLAGAALVIAAVTGVAVSGG